MLCLSGPTQRVRFVVSGYLTMALLLVGELFKVRGNGNHNTNNEVLSSQRTEHQVPLLRHTSGVEFGR